jgi:hypothetical protein
MHDLIALKTFWAKAVAPRETAEELSVCLIPALFQRLGVLLLRELRLAANMLGLGRFVTRW